jgi:hypothetical protein
MTCAVAASASQFPLIESKQVHQPNSHEQCCFGFPALAPSKALLLCRPQQGLL